MVKRIKNSENKILTSENFEFILISEYMATHMLL